MSYAKIDKSILYSNELTSDEKVALFALMDRLSLSMTKGDMYMRNGQYFVKFSQLEMATVVGKSARKIFDVYKHLEELGMIRRKKNRNASDDIFLLGLAESASSNSQELRTSKHDFNKHNITSDTVKTVSINKVDHWKQAVVSKTKLPELAVDTILKFTHNDLAKAYAIVGTINKAKKHVARQYRLLNSPVSRFESNTNIQQQITSKLACLFNYSSKVDNLLAYLKKGLQTFFKDAFGIKKDELVTPHAQSQRKTINIKKPVWMNEEYDPEKDKLSPEDKNDINNLLAEFEKGREEYV